MAEIFADGFESGDVSAWDGSTGTPLVTGAAAKFGSYGMECNASGDFVDDTFTGTATLRIRFWLDPNGFSMSSGNAIRCIIVKDSGTYVGVVWLYYDGSNYQILARMKDDAGSWHDTSYYTITDDYHCIEVLWENVNVTGYMSLWIDGALKETVSSVDTGTRVPDQVEFGWRNTYAGAPSGTLYFDAYVSNDDGGAIGCGEGVMGPMAMMNFRRLREQG